MTPDQLDFVADLLAGSAALPGLAIDTELRWALLRRLAATGRAGDAEIDAELRRDPTRQLRPSARGRVPGSNPGRRAQGGGLAA